MWEGKWYMESNVRSTWRQQIVSSPPRSLHQVSTTTQSKNRHNVYHLTAIFFFYSFSIHSMKCKWLGNGTLCKQQKQEILNRTTLGLSAEFHFNYFLFQFLLFHLKNWFLFLVQFSFYQNTWCVSVHWCVFNFCYHIKEYV